MFSSRSVQIAAVFSDVFGKAFPNLCRSLYNETKAEMFFSVFAVALLAEGVDRNIFTSPCDQLESSVALLAEGVDRNVTADHDVADSWQSPSSRRAWIEISRASVCGGSQLLSPSSRRAWIEILGQHRRLRHRSPSSRRAWIEIPAPRAGVQRVALLAEGVDRNISERRTLSPSRPPRGGRG